MLPHGNAQANSAALPHPALTPLAHLTPYKNNARTHSKRQIAQIARSIERFGFTNPVLIDATSGIIAGHGRVEAARQLGWSAVPTLRVDHLTDVEKRAYMLADNKLAEKAGWDRQLIAIELKGLAELGFDLDFTGFETAELDLIFEEAAETTQTPPENAPPPYNANGAVSAPGDIWILGKHRLICVDARDENSYRLLLGDEKAEFVFTDPPYNVPIDGHVCGLGRIRHQNFAMGCGEMTSVQFTEFLQTVFHHMVAYTTSGSIHQICMDCRATASAASACRCRASARHTHANRGCSSLGITWAAEGNPPQPPKALLKTFIVSF